MNKLPQLKHIVFIAICFAFIIQACNQGTTSKGSSSNSTISGELLADTIIYSVEIKNNDPNDHWTEECLSRLNRSKMVDQLFESVYNHKADVFNYITEAQMSIREVKAIENSEEFSREKVSKLQFWESWYYDEKQLRMTKKVHAILVAYEYNSSDGEFLGHKAAFYIKMK